MQNRVGTIVVLWISYCDLPLNHVLVLLSIYLPKYFKRGRKITCLQLSDLLKLDYLFNFFKTNGQKILL